MRTRRGRLIRAVWMFCARRASASTALSGRFALDVRLTLRLCRGVLLRFTPVFFPLSGKKRRLAVSCVPVPPGRDRHSCVLDVSARLSALAGSFRVCTFLYGDLDGLPGRGDGVTRGTGLAARPLCAFAQSHWPCESFRWENAGAKSGSRTAAAPDCAKESKVEAALPPLWTLFRGWPSERVRFTRPLPRFTSAVCLAPNRTACDILRSCSAGSRSPFVRSRCVSAIICLGGFTSALAVSLWRSRRGYRDAGNGGTGSAARPLCVFAQPHWPCYAFRGENAGAARPRLRQRVFDSLDSLHAAAGLRWCGFAAFVRFCVAALRPPQTAPKSLRLSGLSSGAGRVKKCVLRGGVMLARIRCAVRRSAPPRSLCPFRRAGAPIRRSPRRRESRDTGSSPIRSTGDARCRRAQGAWSESDPS